MLLYIENSKQYTKKKKKKKNLKLIKNSIKLQDTKSKYKNTTD